MDIKILQREVQLLHERVCSAMSDATRIMILYLLSEKSMYVNEIADALEQPQSTISRHLKILRERGLVATERQGTAILYSLPDRRIIEALDLMRSILNDQVMAAALITHPKQINERSQKEKKK
ncbi:MAG TPA: metalloregulator ArsR/SmtB family transcription factor [Anaerolineaceae bacterium]|jgi:DNA-binding transcriptional ArsR family regulator|nr:metalloregulator ArsR/SmtB family transcription factor [Anaerolineaceae bacterium]